MKHAKINIESAKFFSTKNGNKAVKLILSNGDEVAGTIRGLVANHTTTNWVEVEEINQELANSVFFAYCDCEESRLLQLKLKEEEGVKRIDYLIKKLFEIKNECLENSGRYSISDFFDEDSEPYINSENMEIVKILSDESILNIEFALCFKNRNNNRFDRQETYTYSDFRDAQNFLRNGIVNDVELYYFAHSEQEFEFLKEKISDCENFEDAKKLMTKYEEKEEGYYDGNGNLYISDSDLNDEYFSGYENDGKVWYIKMIAEIVTIEELSE